MKLAVYGLIDKNAGSQSSAGHLLVSEFLARGIEVYYYAIQDFIEPKGFEHIPSFVFRPVRHPIASLWRIVERLPFKSLRNIVTVIFSQISNSLHYGAIAKKILSDHASTKFDALFCNGVLCPFAIPDLRTVSWAQGCPLGEIQSIRSNKSRIRKSGLLYKPALELLYWYKVRQARSITVNSSKIVCGSTRTVELWQQLGVPKDRLVSLPYPIDFTRFCKQEVMNPGARFLHLGRIVPRKRVDLLIEAFGRYRESNPTSTLQLIGKFGYATRSEESLIRCAGSRVTYIESLGPAEVAKAIKNADCIIQTSENEDFGSAVAEGLSVGRPCIIGPTNGMRDYVSPHCVTFKSYDVDSVFNAIDEMSTKVLKLNRSECVENCWNAAQKHFRVEKIAEKLLCYLGLKGESNRDVDRAC